MDRDKELEDEPSDDISAENESKETIPDYQNSVTEVDTNLENSNTENSTADENRSKKQSDKQQKEDTLPSSFVSHAEFSLLDDDLEHCSGEFKHSHEEQKQPRSECGDTSAREFEQNLEEKMTKTGLDVSVTTVIEDGVTIPRHFDDIKFDQDGHLHENTPVNERNLQTVTPQNSSPLESGLVDDDESFDSNMSFIVLDSNNSLHDNLQSGHEHEEEHFPHNATTKMDTKNSMCLSSINSNRSDSFSLLSLPNDSLLEARNGQEGSSDLEKMESRPCTLGKSNVFAETQVQSGLPATDPTKIDVCDDAEDVRISENMPSLEMDSESGTESEVFNIESKRLETRLSPDEKKDKKKSTDVDNDKEYLADKEFDIEHPAVVTKIEENLANEKSRKECLDDDKHPADELEVEECPANKKEDKEHLAYPKKAEHPADEMKVEENLADEKQNEDQLNDRKKQIGHLANEKVDIEFPVEEQDKEQPDNKESDIDNPGDEKKVKENSADQNEETEYTADEKKDEKQPADKKNDSHMSFPGLDSNNSLQDNFQSGHEHEEEHFSHNATKIDTKNCTYLSSVNSNRSDSFILLSFSTDSLIKATDGQMGSSDVEKMESRCCRSGENNIPFKDKHVQSALPSTKPIRKAVSDHVEDVNISESMSSLEMDSDNGQGANVFNTETERLENRLSVPFKEPLSKGKSNDEQTSLSSFEVLDSNVSQTNLCETENRLSLELQRNKFCVIKEQTDLSDEGSDIDFVASEGNDKDYPIYKVNDKSVPADEKDKEHLSDEDNDKERLAANETKIKENTAEEIKEKECLDDKKHPLDETKAKENPTVYIGKPSEQQQKKDHFADKEIDTAHSVAELNDKEHISYQRKKEEQLAGCMNVEKNPADKKKNEEQVIDKKMESEHLADEQIDVKYPADEKNKEHCDEKQAADEKQDYTYPTDETKVEKIPADEIKDEESPSEPKKDKEHLADQMKDEEQLADKMKVEENHADEKKSGEQFNDKKKHKEHLADEQIDTECSADEKDKEQPDNKQIYMDNPDDRKKVRENSDVINKNREHPTNEDIGTKQAVYKEIDIEQKKNEEQLVDKKENKEHLADQKKNEGQYAYEKIDTKNFADVKNKELPSDEKDEEQDVDGDIDTENSADVKGDKGHPANEKDKGQDVDGDIDTENSADVKEDKENHADEKDEEQDADGEIDTENSADVKEDKEHPADRKDEEQDADGEIDIENSVDVKEDKEHPADEKDDGQDADGEIDTENSADEMEDNEHPVDKKKDEELHVDETKFEENLASNRKNKDYPGDRKKDDKLLANKEHSSNQKRVKEHLSHDEINKQDPAGEKKDKKYVDEAIDTEHLDNFGDEKFTIKQPADKKENKEFSVDEKKDEDNPVDEKNNKEHHNDEKKDKEHLADEENDTKHTVKESGLEHSVSANNELEQFVIKEDCNKYLVVNKNDKEHPFSDEDERQHVEDKEKNTLISSSVSHDWSSISSGDPVGRMGQNKDANEIAIAGNDHGFVSPSDVNGDRQSCYQRSNDQTEKCIQAVCLLRELEDNEDDFDDNLFKNFEKLHIEEGKVSDNEIDGEDDTINRMVRESSLKHHNIHKSTVEQLQDIEFVQADGSSVGRNNEPEIVNDDNTFDEENKTTEEWQQPKDSTTSQGEQENLDCYEIPHYAIVIKRMWTGVRKDGQNFDEVSISLNSRNELCIWNYLFSNHVSLESLRTNLYQQVQKDKGIFVFLSYVGQPFQDLQQISQWWIQVMDTIKKHLAAVKIYKCRYKWLQEKGVFFVLEKNNLVKEKQVMVGDTDTASREFSLVGLSSNLNAVTLYLMRELGEIEVWTDEGQISILQFKTDAANLQMMKKFHLCTILKEQMDLDLFTEEDEFFVIGVIKQDLDKIEVLLQTTEWMYRFVSKQVLIDEITVEMLQYYDNWNYVKEQLEYLGLTYHMEFSAKHVTLFAESDEAANELVKRVTGCFRDCTFKFLKQQEPKKHIDAILKKYGTKVLTEITSMEYELCVRLWARADKLEDVCEEINCFKSQLDDQLQTEKSETTIIEVNKHVYHFLRQHRNEDLKKVKIDVDETSKDRNIMVMRVTGMSSAIISICDVINNAREDLVTKCVTETFDKAKPNQFVLDLENKHHCCILTEVSAEASATDPDDDVKPSDDYLSVTQTWNYKGTFISVIKCDIKQANVDFVVNPVATKTFGSFEIDWVQKKTVCHLGIPEFSGKGKDKTNLQDAFKQLYEYLKNELNGEHTVAIPVYGVCNWDYRKFVKSILIPIKSLLPRIMLCVPNDDVENEIVKIISDARGGPFTIFVKLGDITKEKVDVIVNTTSKDMELEIGGVSHAILKAAGEKIQKQCKQNSAFGEELPAGEIIVTNGFNLLCKKVYHGALRDWSTGNKYEKQRRNGEMKTFIQKCLREAVKDGMKSLSFPALGTGNLGYPTNQVAEIMLQEIKSFRDEQKPDCSLQEVNIVVFGKDHDTYEIFKKKYEKCVGPSPESSVDLPVQHLRIGETDLEIATGDVKSNAGYEGLVLMWTAEDIRDNSAGAVDIIRDAGKEVLSEWNKLKDKLQREEFVVLNGGNLQFRNILNVCIDRDRLQEGFTVALNAAEAYGLSSVIFSLRDKETKSMDLDKYSLAFYKALKFHENSLSTSLRIKICIEIPEKCAVMQSKLACLNVNDSPTASRVKEVKKVLPRKIVYMVTGKKQEVDIVIKALTDDVTMEMEQAKVTDDQNLDKESLLVEKITKAEDGYDGKTDEFENEEDIYSKEADAGLEGEEEDLQNTFVKSEEVPKFPVPLQESDPVRLQTRLQATGDSRCCLVAVSRKLCKGRLEETLQDTLKMKPEPVAIICPHEEENQALVVYDKEKDSTSVLQNQEVKADLQKLDITLQPMPPEVICNLKAGLDITKLVLAGCRTLQPHVIEQSLRECSGVKIQKTSHLWYLRGTITQLRRASDYLSGLIVKFRTSQIVANSVGDNIAVTVERVTPALYGAYCFFTANSDDKDSLSALNFDKKRECVTIEGTNEKVQEVKKSLERIMKCDCQSINLSSKTLSVQEVKSKLGKIQIDYPLVYFYLKTNNNDTVEDVTFLGLDCEVVKKVKGLAFDKLGLTTNRRNRFAQSDGARQKDSFFLQNHFGAGIGEKDQSYNSRAGPDNEQNISTQRSKNVSHYKAADVFDVFVYRADILDLEVDCIVNAANSKLDHSGGVANAIAEAAGSQFVKESKQHIKCNGEVKVGLSCHTGAGKLKYRYVIHTVGPRWHDYPKHTRSDRCSELLCQAVESAILEANDCKVIKVALPAISSGIYGVPHEICVTQYALGIIGACFKLENQKKIFLKEIHFVDKNAGMINMIKAKFKEFLSVDTEAGHPLESPNNFSAMQDDGEQHQEFSQQRKYQKNIWSNERHNQSQLHSPPPQKIQRMDNHDGNDRHHQNTKAHQHGAPKLSVSQQHDRSEVYPYSGSTIEHEVFKHIYQLNESTQIQVYSLDILDCNVDALVFGEDKELTTKSRIGRAIHEIDKKAFDAEIKKLKSRHKKITIGTVHALQLTYVRQNVILLLVTPSWGMQGTTEEDCMNGIKKGIISVLKRCSELGLRSIAMPILGTGNPGAPILKVSEVIIDKIQEYFTTSGGYCPIKQVHIVSKDESNIKILTNILDKHVDKFNRCDKRDIVFLSRKTYAASFGASSFTANRHNNNDMLPKLKYGNQPKTGKMDVVKRRPPGVPGFEDVGVLVITYSFPDGIQLEDHPNPGVGYKGTSRMCYLPDTKRGKLILKMFRIAFDRRLTFTVGRSRTTGEENVITWNDIHHKTNYRGGEQGFGYPDDGYFDRVTEELRVKGITPADVQK